MLPEARSIVQVFGRGSLTFSRAKLTLDRLWAELQDDPEVRLKRDLCDGLLREAYGEEVGKDSLFLQHTYLTIVVKTIAARVLDLDVTDPARLLSGRVLADLGILGAVEADFFDWPLKRGAGSELVRQIAAETARFRLTDVQTDVLKVLYESLVDPDEHDSRRQNSRFRCFSATRCSEIWCCIAKAATASGRSCSATWPGRFGRRGRSSGPMC